jgi:hypothetical protein
MQNLLTDFLQYTSDEQKRKLLSLPIRGKEKIVWSYLLTRSKKGGFSKETTLSDINISSTHFDKICSAILTRCYVCLVPNGGIDLLTFLANSRVLIPHFYKEASRQLKLADQLSQTDAQSFLKKFISLYIDSIPVMFRKNEIYEKASRKYLQLSDSTTKIEDNLYITYTKIWLEINVHFAAGTIRKKEATLSKKMNQLKPDFSKSPVEIIYQWYWTMIYLKQSIEDNLEVAQLAEAALKVNYQNTAIKLRLQMKYAESLYFISRFEESFKAFYSILSSNNWIEIPNISYFTTRYLQVCLITENFSIVKTELERVKKDMGISFTEQIITRDVITFVKYFILTSEYEAAYTFIRLGYLKNPKAKYLQYEIELRNLETAYYYLSGNISQALNSCERNLRYLRTKGFGVKTSPYPYFFVLVKAFAEKRLFQKQLSNNEMRMMSVFQRGTNAVYGKILHKISAY